MTNNQRSIPYDARDARPLPPWAASADDYHAALGAATARVAHASLTQLLRIAAAGSTEGVAGVWFSEGMAAVAEVRARGVELPLSGLTPRWAWRAAEVWSLVVRSIHARAVEVVAADIAAGQCIGAAPFRVETDAGR